VSKKHFCNLYTTDKEKMNNQHQQLIDNLQIAINWNDIITKTGYTQKAEHVYINVIRDQMIKLGAVVDGINGSQKHIDFIDVKWSNGTVCSYECKKVNKGTTFMFNDTVPMDNVYYMFIYVDKKIIKILKGSDVYQHNHVFINSIRKEFINTVGKHVMKMLSKDDFTNQTIKEFFDISINFMCTCVSHGILSLFDFGQLFKNTKKFGNMTSRPRPNWTIKIPY